MLHEREVERAERIGPFTLPLGHRAPPRDVAAPEHVVRHDHSARREAGDQELQVAGVLLLHAVHVGKIDRLIDLRDLGDGRPLPHLDPAREPGLLDERARGVREVAVHLDRHDVRPRPRRAREDDRAVPDVRPELDDELRRAGRRRDREERRDLGIADRVPALGRERFHLCEERVARRLERLEVVRLLGPQDRVSGPLHFFFPFFSVFLSTISLFIGARPANSSLLSCSEAPFSSSASFRSSTTASN